jgi:hypothetical protein
MKTKSAWTIYTGAMLALTGCASQNYDFTAVTNSPSRVAILANDLDRVAHDTTNDNDELYDISVMPLIHSRLHVFAEADEKDQPAQYIEANIDSYLPLFAFVNSEFAQYNEHQELITRHEINSGLWGAFRKETELIVTPTGYLEKTRHTVFWMFSWWGDERRISYEMLSQNYTP